MMRLFLYSFCRTAWHISSFLRCTNRCTPELTGNSSYFCHSSNWKRTTLIDDAGCNTIKTLICKVHRGAAVVLRQVPTIFSVDDKDPAAHGIMMIRLDLCTMSWGLNSTTTSAENKQTKCSVNMW